MTDGPDRAAAYETPAHRHRWSKWVEATFLGHFFRVCLDPHCAAREDM